MKRFATLCTALEGAGDDGFRVALLAAYLRDLPEQDRLWCIALLSGQRPRRLVRPDDLALWAAEAAGLPAWLLAEAAGLSGDPVETAALIHPHDGAGTGCGLAQRMAWIAGLHGLSGARITAAVLGAWAEEGPQARFRLNQLLAGGFRLKLPRGLLAAAIARCSGRSAPGIARRLAGPWNPGRSAWADLLPGTGEEGGNPHSFAEAEILSGPPDALGAAAEWQAQWLRSGLRCQLVRHLGGFDLWMPDGDCVTSRFPDLAGLGHALPPGTVLDGWLRPGGEGAELEKAFAARLKAKGPARRDLAAAPARYLVADLLEAGGTDLRPQPFALRHARLKDELAALPRGLPILAEPAFDFGAWSDLALSRAAARDHGASGLLLRRLEAAYGEAGAFRLWPAEPRRIAAVLLSVETGGGGTIMAGTFGLRRGGVFLPVARAALELPPAESSELQHWVRSNTRERFGPTRMLPPELVFTIAFAEVRAAPRRKSGVTLVAPMVSDWRRGDTALDAGSLEMLEDYLRETP